jgi:hypothetical protein
MIEVVEVGNFGTSVETIEVGNIGGPPGPPGPPGPGGSVATDVIWDAKGDLAVATAPDTATKLPIGANSQVLTADSTQATGLKWATPAAGGGGGSVATDNIWDAKGDLAVATAPDTATKLPIGTNNQVLTADSAQATGLKWATPAAGGGSVATDILWDAKGDIAVATAPDTATKLPVGANNQVLTADSAQASGLKWATPASPGTVATDILWDTKGDIAVATAPDTAAKLPVGANNQVLTADSAQTSGLKWATPATGNMTLTETAVKSADYTAVAGEYVLFDTTSGARMLTLPPTPADGALVGARIVTFAGTNYVSATATGGDVFGKPGASAIANNALQMINQGLIYQYHAGVWTTIATTFSLFGLDGRYSNRLFPSGLKTSNYSAAANEFVPGDTSAAAFTITLPTAPAHGTLFGTKLVTAGNPLSVARGGTDMIGKLITGTSPKVLSGVGQTLFMVYDSAGVWYEVDDVANTPAQGTNITFDAASNGTFNINVEPVIADIWTPKWVRMTADDPPTPSQTTTTVSSLTLPYTTNATYTFKFVMLVDTTQAAGFKWIFSALASGASGMWWTPLDVHTSATAVATINATKPPFTAALPGTSQTVGHNVAALGTVLAHTVEGWLVSTTTAGNLVLQTGQNVSTAVNTTLKAGSNGFMQRVL